MESKIQRSRGREYVKKIADEYVALFPFSFLFLVLFLTILDREIPGKKTNKLPNLSFLFGFLHLNGRRSIFRDGPSQIIFRLHVIHGVIKQRELIEKGLYISCNNCLKAIIIAYLDSSRNQLSFGM